MARSPIDRRSVAVSVTIALIVAIGAGLVTSFYLRDRADSGATVGGLKLTQAGDVDPAAVRAVPLRTPDDTATTLGDQLGPEATLVNLWQSTCAPCIDEMPLLDRAAADHPQVPVVGVAVQDTIDDAAKLADQTAITYPWLVDPDGELFATVQAAGLPTTVLVDGDGRLLGTHTGAFLTQGEIDRFLDDHLPKR